MASPKSRPRDGKPGRALGLILVVAVALAAVMFGTGHKTPRLGIDLAGGTSVTLTATSKDPKAVNASNMAIATNIINERVNAFGVSEATVQTQGSDTIVVSIPKGENNQSAADEVGKTAKLYFRPVLAEAASGAASSGSSPSASSSAKAHPSGSPSAKASASPQGKAVSSGLEKAAATPTAGSSAKAAASSPPAAAASAPATSSVAGTVPDGLDKAFTALDCSNPKSRIDYQTSTTADAVACSQDAQSGVWYKYALGPVAVNGDQISGASATLNTSTGTGWQVNLNLKSKGSKQFSDTTAKLATQQTPQNQFAIVMDGQVVSSPYVSSAITGGQAQITGNFTQQDAQNLANVLSFGALPLDFQQSSVNTVSASLGGDQLTVGLVAGGVGLVLVMIYLLLYYRMLGVIAIGSLALTAVLNYEAMVLLGPLMGFTLSLPGIAGAIIAIGITADSFVVFFERLRDELREGRSLRPAVQHGWTRARRTILVSDFVTLLAAVVIYLVTVGDVKGFAFTLGLTTVIDVMVVFLFTKPVVTLASRRKFFTSGHPWSGVDPQRLGAKKTRSPLGRRLSGRGSAGSTSTEAKEA
ncbi:protein translocase subunit SecD [Phaeacidiphilus oryzae]|uniref:protein translocase subunit SecD n=1 Tax=Phaeacidiphilus oryzae TaxID=348818 RepID=UPI000564F06C